MSAEYNVSSPHKANGFVHLICLGIFYGFLHFEPYLTVRGNLCLHVNPVKRIYFSECLFLGFVVKHWFTSPHIRGGSIHPMFAGMVYVPWLLEVRNRD